ncbi:MAG: SDR family NAD(P)-dependent oxidoreductase [Chloroflexi bacterium]|nr:SDR family NAD(P)-dependent oxidoreductase [Chloroflexota bacterium]
MERETKPAYPELEGRVVVVTGGARGMGKAYVEGFLSAKARVVATDKSWSGVDDFRRALEANESALVLDMDVTSDAEIDRAYDAALTKFGTVDVLINNAALLQMLLVNPTGRVTTLETTDEEWLKSFGVNVFGALKVTRRFIRPMIEKRAGSVINIVSSGILSFSHGGGYVAPRPGSREMPYMASKAALATMSFYLADEVKSENVAVNIIIPGHTRGSWFDDAIRARRAAGMQPGRRPNVPKHIVPLAMFLACQDGRGVTGRMFDVMAWNEEHGLGGHERWEDRSLPADLDDAFSAADVGPVGVTEGSGSAR